MILFFLILIAIFSVSTTIVFWMELSILSNTVDWLDERLCKLEKDAVKVTFNEPPLFHPKPKTQTDYRNEHTTHKEVKSKKRKPKTVKEWEDEVDLGGHE